MPPKKQQPFQEMLDVILKFRQDRDWKQFHNPKDMSLSLTLEASELLEHFQWKNGKELEEYIQKNKSAIGDELIDILSWVLLISHDLDIDLVQAFYKKKKQDAKKYPAKKVRGKAAKYTEY
jgi:NTP pyrophosphatase (non-canonical NTP hydrolase)